MADDVKFYGQDDVLRRLKILEETVLGQSSLITTLQQNIESIVQTWTPVSVWGSLVPTVIEYMKIKNEYLLHIKYTGQIFDGNIGDTVFSFDVNQYPFLKDKQFGIQRILCSMDISGGRIPCDLDWYGPNILIFPILEKQMSGPVRANVYGDSYTWFKN